MANTEIAKMTTKGQISISGRIRKLLHLEEGSSVDFGITKDGMVIVPCKLKVQNPYTAKEWIKIEKLAAERGLRVKIRKTLKRKEGVKVFCSVVFVPSSEAWIYQNSAVISKICKGLQEAGEGKVKKIGNLEKFFKISAS